MSGNQEKNLAKLMKMASDKIAKLEAELEAVKSKDASEPIAIVGMGCRFPGNASTPEAYWDILQKGVDSITEVPKDRWNIDDYYDPDPEAPGKISTRYGGFVEQLQEFDSKFFEIAPLETRHLDPQQRLLLEVSWEALENGGKNPQELRESQTGVFIGICSGDYRERIYSQGEENLDAYVASGNSHSTASGRISYILGLVGPNIAVDTACSSSLVSIHLACASLRNQECNMALAGGVNRLVSPELSINFSKARMLSFDGRCKTFDSKADGFVRGEGCGIVVLKRLSDAVADADNIRAVIRGTAINQDGNTSGLTVPNGPSQQAVIRQALENGGVDPANVSYIEAHGTGTALGDPIEVGSIGKVFAQTHSQEQPLIIGSVKTNIGHLEGAAGVAGLIKVVLQLQHKQIAPSLHFDRPNPYINWSELPVQVSTELTPWQVNGIMRRAGISSFGFSGTNAHIVLEEAPIRVKTESAIERPLHVLTLSAKTEKALEDLVSRYQEHLSDRADLSLPDVCYTANTGRSHFDHSLAVIASQQEELAEKLIDYKAGREVAGLFHNKQQLPGSAAPKIAFLFTGQGSQYVNMGRQLYQTQAVFREAMDRCDRILRAELEKSLLEVIYPETKNDLGASQAGTPTLLDQTAYTQPALFAIEYALYQLWQSWGIQPAAVMGHSVGEYVAACIAGVFSLEDGLKLIATRGRLMQQLPVGGEMLSVMAEVETVRHGIAPYAEQVALAALNGPESIVISGVAEAIGAIARRLESEGIKTKQLQVSHAFHSPLMAPMLAEFEEIAKQVKYRQPSMPVISNVTGIRADNSIAEAKYWVNHVGQPVRFGQSMQTLHEQGYEVFLEIGPKPVLLGMGRQCLPEEVGVWLPSIGPGADEWQQLLSSLGKLYVRGVDVDWSGFERKYSRQKVELPTYPFQRERYWIESNCPGKKKYLSREKVIHPLLGERLYIASQQQQLLCESLLGSNEPAYLSHHRVFDKAIFPTTGYVEMALAAGKNKLKTPHLVLSDLEIGRGMILPEGELKLVQTILTPAENQAYKFQIFTQKTQKNQEEPQWVLHTSGKIKSAASEAGSTSFDIEKALGDCPQQIEVAQHYRECRERGIDYGTSFQGIQQLWKGKNQAIAKIKLPEELLAQTADYQFHPALLDAALQVSIQTIPETNNNETYLPFGVEQMKVYGYPGLSLWAWASVTETVERGEVLIIKLTLASEKREIIATIEGLRVKKATVQSLQAIEQESITNWLYEVEWRAKGRFGRLLPPEALLTPAEVEQQLLPTVTELVAKLDKDSSKQIQTSLEELSLEYVVQALWEIGWSYKPGESFTSESVAQDLGIAPSHKRLFNRILQVLAEAGIVQLIQQRWQVLQTIEKVNPDEKSQMLRTHYPEESAAFTLLHRCGSKLSGVLRGIIDPVQLVFPEGDLSTATQLYTESIAAKVMNTIVQKSIAKAIEKLPLARGVRLLEIGAGTGGTTSYILPQLSPANTEYVFTDIGTLFTAKAKEKFRDYPFVDYRTLDIEVDPTSQGFEAHQYDVIIAANVLHATSRMKQTLSHVQKMLAPGGMLVLLEATSRQGWVDLVFGLLEGWWKFQDRELRPDYPLLSRNTWKQLLGEMGFTQVVTMPEISGMPEILSQQTVIVAQGSKTRFSETGSEQKGWLLLADKQGIAQKLASQLRSVGEACTLVFAGEQYQQIGAEEFRINPDKPEEMEQVVETVAAKNQSLYGVVQCWTTKTGVGENINSQELANLSSQGCGTTLCLVQALVNRGWSQPPRLWLATSGSQAVPGERPVIPGVSQASVWGMGKAIALEHPELNCRRVDLDPNQTVEQQAEELFNEVWSEDREDQVALRGDERYVARLVAKEPGGQTQPLSFRSDATYLLTGGMGGLGLLVSSWMVERGAKHLVLVGRRMPDAAARQKITSLEKAGASVVVEKADVSDVESLGRVLHNIEQSPIPLAGVMHGAGMLSDGVLQNQSWQSFAKVMAPKVQGGWHLHKLTQNQPLDFFVLFSSAASLLGAAGQGNHSAANGFLDGLAHYRRSMGLPGLSIHWGPISQIGEAAERGADVRFQRQGMGAIAPAQVLESLELLMGSASVEVAVVPLDWSAWQDRVAQWPFLAEWKQTATATAETGKFGLIQQLKQAVKSERRELLVGHVRGQLAEVLGFSSDLDVDLTKGFFDLGIDSLMAVELRNRLQNNLGCNLPSTLTFKYPTPNALGDYLFELLLEVETDEEQTVKPKDPKEVEVTSQSNIEDLSDEETEKSLLNVLDKLGY